ncbi:MAG: hypothetical protein JWP67_2323 [Mucilaginibacter sp.]|nr:hypothetical protein [Mucilaginibacter sp.]
MISWLNGFPASIVQFLNLKKQLFFDLFVLVKLVKQLFSNLLTLNFTLWLILKTHRLQ